MKILLHIGQSKTGTSAIQAYLTLNRERLARAGITYPGVKIGGSFVGLSSHNAVADALTGVYRYPHLTIGQYMRQFFDAAEYNGSKQMILSAEHFFGGEPRTWNTPDEKTFYGIYQRKVATLADHLKGHEVSLLVYLRPQVDWLASAISQTVRIERLIGNQHIYKNDQQFFELSKPVLRYYDLLEIWREELLPTSVSVVPYDRRILHSNNSIADFIHRTDLDSLISVGSMATLEVNQSLTREYLEIKKLLNQQPRSKADERTLISCLERLSRKSNLSTKYQLSNELIEEVRDFARKQNRQLSEKYGLGQDCNLTIGIESSEALLPLSDEVLSKARAIFEKEYRSPRSQFIYLRHLVLAWLRKYAKPVHALLHQVRRMQWKFRKL